MATKTANSPRTTKAANSQMPTKAKKTDPSEEPFKVIQKLKTHKYYLK
jgi:hypothetical protein